MPADSVDAIVAELCGGGWLTPTQQRELVQDIRPRYDDARLLARQLLQRNWLTPFQVNKLLQGRWADLLFGSYIFLERLGEGGTGQVFKARHQRMDRIVAVKLIRAELLADPEVVQRFYREVRVLSQLSHPNVVHAYDAGQIGATHFLVMEYVEGMDLSQLVKKKGPLAAGQASSYIRQAACGLAHAHEKKLVHRDIKPSNLLVTQTQRSGSVVKILDLGLARLRSAADGEITTTLTPVGAGGVTMGTLDYLAPEQALDFHQVDIRADIYSLGCTFFYLLTGQPPFPGGSMAQKLMRHQQVPPPPLNKFRADVPPNVEEVLRRMLVKQPEGRFQTPDEVAASLAELGSRIEPASGSATATTYRMDGDARSPSVMTGGWGKRRWLLLGGAVGLIALAAFLASVFMPGSPKKTVDTGAATARPNTFPSTPTPQREFVLQGRPVVRDALIDSDKPNQQLGGVPRFNKIVHNQDRTTAFLVHFDLAKLGPTSQMRVEKAYASFYVWNPHNSRRPIKVCPFPLLTPWDEATTTWRQPVAGKPWKGGKNFAFGMDTGPIGPPIVVLPNRGKDSVDPPIEYQLDVTRIVQEWLNGAANHGLAIAAVADRGPGDERESFFQIYSSQHHRVQFTPKLTIRVSNRS